MIIEFLNRKIQARGRGFTPNDSDPELNKMLHLLIESTNNVSGLTPFKKHADRKMAEVDNSDAGLKSEDALILLKKHGPNKYKKKDTIPMPITVVRDGRLRPLMPIDLVPGDIVHCTEGKLRCQRY